MYIKKIYIYIYIYIHIYIGQRRAPPAAAAAAAPLQGAPAAGRGMDWVFVNLGYLMGMLFNNIYLGHGFFFSPGIFPKC